MLASQTPEMRWTNLPSAVKSSFPCYPPIDPPLYSLSLSTFPHLPLRLEKIERTFKPSLIYPIAASRAK